MTTPGGNDPSEELLLVAIVEMASGSVAAGQQYEDTVLALLDRHGGSVERRMRSMDSTSEVHIIRFGSRAGYESFMADPNRLAYRDRIGDAAPTTRVLEVCDLETHALRRKPALICRCGAPPLAGDKCVAGCRSAVLQWARRAARYVLCIRKEVPAMFAHRQTPPRIAL